MAHQLKQAVRRFSSLFRFLPFYRTHVCPVVMMRSGFTSNNVARPLQKYARGILDDIRNFVRPVRTELPTLSARDARCGPRNLLKMRHTKTKRINPPKPAFARGVQSTPNSPPHKDERSLTVDTHRILTSFLASMTS